MQMSMFSSEEHPVNPSRSQDYDLGWMTHGGTSRSSILQSLTAIAPNGSFGRMFRGYCRPGKDGILEPSSGVWANSGMGSPTECLMLNTSEQTDSRTPWRSAEGGCLLSDILETGSLPPHLYLSQDACQKIILRAEQHGLIIPEHALEALVQQSTR